MTDDDRLVADYLRRLRRAARGLPRGRRGELIGEITEHIAEARAAAAQEPTGETIPDILGQLGQPAEIVRAAGGPAMARRPGGLEITAVILLMIGGFIFLVGWVAGCVLLWISPRWRWPDKLLGTLVWPGGLLALAVGAPLLSIHVGQCSGTGMVTSCGNLSLSSAWLAVILTGLAAALAAEVLVTIRLVRRARRLPEPEPTAPQPSYR
jgi:hypothetical protein